MSTIFLDKRPAAASDLPVKHVTARKELSEIRDDETDAIVWSRSLPHSFTQWLNALSHENLPEGRFVLKPSDTAKCIADLFESIGVPPSTELTWLCEDALCLASEVSEIAESDHIRLRLEPVFDNACAKFHIDNVFARLICTYRGPGTQVVLDGALNNITSIATGAPILLKGRLWPQSGDLSLRHRSPPIEGLDLARLVLVVEGVSDEELAVGRDPIYTP